MTGLLESSWWRRQPTVSGLLVAVLGGFGTGVVTNDVSSGLTSGWISFVAWAVVWSIWRTFWPEAEGSPPAGEGIAAQPVASGAGEPITDKTPGEIAGEVRQQMSIDRPEKRYIGVRLSTHGRVYDIDQDEEDKHLAIYLDDIPGVPQLVAELPSQRLAQVRLLDQGNRVSVSGRILSVGRDSVITIACDILTRV